MVACWAGIGMALAALPVAAQETVQQREHTVRRGDTLWDLARVYLSNPFLWPAIYEANRAVVRDPHWIYPAERLVIPGRLAGGAGDGSEIGVSPDALWTAPAPTRFQRDAAGAAATVLSTAAEVARPLVRETEYRSTPWLADPAALGIAGRVEALVDPADVSTRMPTTLRPREQVYLGALAGRVPAAGDSLLIVRLGRVVPGFGQIVQPLAVLLVDSLPEGVPSATIVRQFGDARIGDAVVALGALPVMPTAQHGAESGAAVNGRLLQFVELHGLYGAADYGFVDLGRTHGVSIGDELSVYVQARPDEPRRPATAVATVRVIRVEAGTATVRVVGVTSTALAPGLPVRLVRRAS
jgi:hypothetical protein